MIAALAARQHGVVSRGQLLELGLTASQIDYRVRIGRLHVVYRGAYAVGHRRISAEGRRLAAVLSCGEGAVLSHRSAGAQWGIAPYAGGLVEVTVAAGRHPRVGLTIHAGRLHADDRGLVDGIPITSVARTLLDLAEVVDERRVERAVERAEKLDLLDLTAIGRACERGRGRRGLKVLGRAIALYAPDDRTHSELEREFAAFCRHSEVRMPVFNALVDGCEVDALWRAARLIVELDGWEHHRSRAAFETDRRRDARLALAGYRVIRVTWRRLRDDPDGLAAALRALT